MRENYWLLGVLLCATLMMGTSLQASPRKWGQWQNSLKPKGEAAKEIALAENGQTDYVVVLPDSPTTQEQKAAEDLAQWLGEMTGAEFPIVSDAKPAQEKEISVGRSTRLAEAGQRIAKEDLGENTNLSRGTAHPGSVQ